jgi:hypothetical protein
MAFFYNKARELKTAELAVYVDKKIAENFVQKAILGFEILSFEVDCLVVLNFSFWPMPCC